MPKIYFLIVLNVRSPTRVSQAKTKVSTGLHFFLESLGKNQLPRSFQLLEADPFLDLSLCLQHSNSVHEVLNGITSL